MENGLQNGLKCILRDIDFKAFCVCMCVWGGGGGPPDPL